MAIDHQTQPPSQISVIRNLSMTIYPHLWNKLVEQGGQDSRIVLHLSSHLFRRHLCSSPPHHPSPSLTLLPALLGRVFLCFYAPLFLGLVMDAMCRREQFVLRLLLSVSAFRGVIYLPAGARRPLAGPAIIAHINQVKMLLRFAAL